MSFVLDIRNKKIHNFLQDGMKQSSQAFESKRPLIDFEQCYYFEPSIFLKFQTKGFPYQISLFESENGSTQLSETCYRDADYLPFDCLKGKKIIIVIMDPLLKKGNTSSWIKKFKEYIMVEMYTVALKTYFFNVKKSTGFNNLILTQLLNPFDNFNFYHLKGIMVLFLIELFLRLKIKKKCFCNTTNSTTSNHPQTSHKG